MLRFARSLGRGRGWCGGILANLAIAGSGGGSGDATWLALHELPGAGAKMAMPKPTAITVVTIARLLPHPAKIMGSQSHVANI